MSRSIPENKKNHNGLTPVPAGEPWLDQLELHRRWWIPVIETLNFFRLAPNGLARALEWLSTTRGVDATELGSWDDLTAWAETNMRFWFITDRKLFGEIPFNLPDPSGPPVTEQPTIRIDIPDREGDWRVAAGLSSGPPPPSSFRQLYHDQGTTARRGRAFYFCRGCA